MITIRHGAIGKVVEINAPSFQARVNLENMKRGIVTHNAHALFQWRRDGYKGYPDLKS